MSFDEGFERDLALRHEAERLGVELGLAAPGSLDGGIEGHRVGQPDLDLVECESDHHERGCIGEEPKGGRLTGGGAGAFEDLPAVGLRPPLLDLALDGTLDGLEVRFGGIDRELRSVVRQEFELGRVDVDRDDMSAESSPCLSNAF